jgi:hypothetical protein
MRNWILVLALLVAPVPAAQAVDGNVCTIVADCLPAVDFDLFNSLGAVDVDTPPWTVFFDAHHQLGTDPFSYCRIDYSAVGNFGVSSPPSLIPIRSPSPQPDENIGCVVMPDGPTPFVPTADTRIVCFIEDQTPATGPNFQLDPLQGELLLDWAVTPGAPSFIGPTLAFDEVVMYTWNGTACVPATSYSHPTESTVTSMTVVPEPGVFAGMAAGLGVLALLHRRRVS